MKCKKCGFENREDIKFCEECGEKLTVTKLKIPRKKSRKAKAVSEQTLRCPHCDFQNRPGISFCEECGESISVQAAPTPEPIQEPQLQTQRCPSCAFENRPGIAFCEECGQPLAEPVKHIPIPVEKPKPSVRVCPSCGFSNRPEIVFCEECGESLSRRRRVFRGIAAFFTKILTAIKSNLQNIVSVFKSRPYRSGFYALATVCLVLLIGSTIHSLFFDYTKFGARKLATTVVTSLYPEMEGTSPYITHYRENGHSYSTYTFSKDVIGDVRGGGSIEFTVNVVLNVNRTNGEFEVISSY